MKNLICIIIICFFTLPVFSDTFGNDTNSDGKDDSWLKREDGKKIFLSDQNHDGEVDSKVIFDTRDRKIREEYDHNYDGAMDTFYFYTSGIFVRQEIDSNYDGKTDIWIFMYKGRYIKRYEVDTDFDGKVDKIKNFGEDK